MTKPFLVFLLKCSAILYFEACSSIDQLTIAKSASPVITKGVWKVATFTFSSNDKSTEFSGYNIVFSPYGEISAVKNGITVKGNWSEDNFEKRITIDLGKSDPVLAKLNDYWNIKDIANLQVNLQSAHHHATENLKITAL